MNAALGPKDMLISAADALAAGDSRDRRGPFRPEKLISARERRSGEMMVRLFRLADIAALTGLGLYFLIQVTPQGVFEAPLAHSLPFITTIMLARWAANALNLYRFGRREKPWPHMLRLYAVLMTAFGLSLTLALTLEPSPAVTEALLDYAGVSALVFGVAHLSWWMLVRRWRRQGKLTPSIVVVGATKHAQKLIKAAIEERNVNILGVFDDRLTRVPESVVGVPVLGNVSDLLTHKITPYVDQIVIALDTSAKARVKDLIEKLRALPNEVSLMVDIDTESERKAALSRMADMPLARVSGVTEDERKALHKRIEDVVIGTLALILFSPLMLITALLIKLDSPGPVFFRQSRHGFNNEAIRVWKFRSMYTHMTDHTAAQQVQKADARVTRIGRFIRKTSIDELPQLFNVLAGEMSLVGPRPHAIGMKTGPSESARLVAEYAWRHRMKPGVTGWAAINGSRGPMDSAADVRRRIALDIEYIERQSVWFDLYIMAMTIPCLLGDTKTVR